MLFEDTHFFWPFWEMNLCVFFVLFCVRILAEFSSGTGLSGRYHILAAPRSSLLCFLVPLTTSSQLPNPREDGQLPG